jgi:hypothetical protein
VSFESFMVHDLTIVRPGTATGRGSDVVKDWATATDTAATGWIAQANADDVRDDRAGDVSEWTLQTAAATDIAPGDRVVWGDLTFDVVGRPNPAWTPRGEHHIEARLRVVEG